MILRWGRHPSRGGVIMIVKQLMLLLVLLVLLLLLVLLVLVLVLVLLLVLVVVVVVLLLLLLVLRLIVINIDRRITNTHNIKGGGEAARGLPRTPAGGHCYGQFSKLHICLLYYTM